MTAISLDRLVKEAKDLPALPTIVTKVFNLIENPLSSAGQLSDLIMTDQGLVSKILKMANSAYYGRAKEITTLHAAITLLGYKAIKEIVLAISMAQIYNKEIKGYGLEKGALWRHSLATAIASGVIAKKVRYKDTEEAYIGGLLHDLGKLILDQHVGGALQMILKKAGTDGITFKEAEHEVLGFDHTEAGGLVAEKWNLPAGLVEVIRYHHSPGEAQINPRLTAIIHLANCLILTLGIGLGYEGLLAEIHEPAVVLLGLSASDLEGLLAELVTLVADETIFKL